MLRAERDWTQADLADRVGISRQAVISIEKYKYTPSLELAFKIAETFGVSIDEVFKYGEEKYNERTNNYFDFSCYGIRYNSLAIYSKSYKTGEL